MLGNFLMTQSKPSLLIVDDDLPTLELYQRELSEDYLVLTCQERAQAELLKETPGLCAIILEPTLSGGDGWKLLAYLNKLKNRLNFSVILCSTSDERKRGIREGAHVFLTKPVLPAALHTLLDQIVTEKQAKTNQSLERES
jgi:response regulator RpfG family c-di-GMP phosphodiesterase